jgi:triosephosphate isomerase (TIM)
MRPVVIVNCKTYPEATGEKAVKLAKLCEEMAELYDMDIRIAVQATDISRVADAVKIPVYAQHVDAAVPGKTTGAVTAHALKKAGASGSLLNHSEHHLTTAQIKDCLLQLKKEKLDAIVCASTVHKLEEYDVYLEPTMFVIEPPELIAGEVSVSVVRPDVVGSAVHATRRMLLVGAGVKDYNDLSVALHLGARGVLLSSHIVLAKDQRKALQKLLTARAR